MTSRLAWALASAPLVFLLVACSASEAGMADMADDVDGGAAGAAGAGGAAGSGGSGGSAGLPPEREVEGSYESPVATGSFVWSANPTSGRVAYIDATSLAVKTVEAGDGPTYLAAVPSATADVAIVLNVRSDDATMLRHENGALASTTFPVAHGANRWSLSPDGRFAAAWTDARRETNPDPTQGFQDVTVVDLAAKPPTPTTLAVGYRPVQLVFSQDSTRAFAVTEDGVSVLDVTASPPRVAKNVPLTTDVHEDPDTRDVSITPSGAYALVRHEGRPDVTVADLATGQLGSVVLPANVTDLDLSDQGDRAVAVLRDAAEVVELPIPAIAGDPTSFTTLAIDGETIGSVALAPGGAVALLYTNAIDDDHLTVLDVAAGTYRVLRLHAPVLAVFPAPDAKSAIVLHRAAADGGTMAGALSVVPLAGDLPAKIVGTDAPPLGVAIAPSGDRAVVTTRDDAKHAFAAYLCRMPSLAVDRIPLASPPDAAGIVAGAGRAFVAQKHPEGRITFVDLAGGEARTLTGFELGAQIVDGSQP